MSGEMSVREAGARGGQATLAKHGVAYFRAMQAAQPVKPASYYRAISKLGQTAQRAQLGPDGLAEHQRRAGEALLARKGVEHFRELGRRSAAAKKAAREARP